MSDPQTAQSRLHDLAGSVFGLFALVMLITSPWQVDTSGPDPFYKGPLLFPIIVFCLILTGALPAMFRLIRPAPDASWILDGQGRPAKTLVILSLLILYVAGLTVIGLEAATWLFLTLSLIILGQATVARMIFFPAGVTLALYLVFKLFLDTWFPEPLILEWLPWLTTP